MLARIALLAMKNGQQTLDLLIVSDTHGVFPMLAKLNQWIASNKPNVDYVIFPGDFTNIFPNQMNDTNLVNEAEAIVLQTVSQLSAITNKQVIFIPGNHEPPKQYTGELKPVGGINIHKSYIKLADNLVMIGLGGSVPGMQLVNGSYVQVWEPYPYKDDEDYKKNLDETLNKAFSMGESTDYVLLTHVGPWNSSTAIYNKKVGNPIYSGSQSLGDALIKYQDKIICNIHGHTHTCDGKEKYTYKLMEIINPGAMKLGYFASVQLIRKSDGHWRLNSVVFNCLEDYPVEE